MFLLFLPRFQNPKLKKSQFLLLSFCFGCFSTKKLCFSNLLLWWVLQIFYCSSLWWVCVLWRLPRWFLLGIISLSPSMILKLILVSFLCFVYKLFWIKEDVVLVFGPYECWKFQFGWWIVVCWNLFSGKLVQPFDLGSKVLSMEAILFKLEFGSAETFCHVRK